MLSEYLNTPWRTFVLAEAMLQSGTVCIWFASNEPCYVNNDCIYYEQHRLASINQSETGWHVMTDAELRNLDLHRVFIQYGNIALAPAAECLPMGFKALIDPIRLGKITLSRNRSLLE